MPAANVKAAKKPAPGSAMRSRGARELSSEELHVDMVEWGKKNAKTKASARAFLKRIGAAVKD